MKELTIEEKAKRYDEAIDKIVDVVKASTIEQGLAEWLFPELKESKDERIRKYMIKYFEASKDELSKGFRWNGITVEECIAWLEKQGEHLENYDESEKEKADFVGDGFIKCHADFLDFKEGNTYWLEYIGDDKYNVKSDNLLGKTYHITPCQLYTVFKKLTWLEKQHEQKLADKVEPKFKVGDWITNGEEIGQVIEWNHPDCIGYKTTYGTEKAFNKEGISKWHKWTIQDAKDGDVLATNSWLFIFKYTNNKALIQFHCNCPINGKPYKWSFLSSDSYLDIYKDDIKPATKEQCDTLEKAMTDAGYTFDFDKKELKKIEDEHEDYKKQVMFEMTDWSEEDEKFFKTALWHISYSISNGKSTDINCDTTDWLKSLKQRYTWKPSDEQMQALSNAGNSFRPFEEDHKVLWGLYNDLKKLREV